MQRIEGGICAIEGVRACGVRAGKYGLALIAASGAAAGMFTTNHVRAAPLTVTAEHLAGGRLDGIIANSGCANAYTGPQGMEDARKMASLLAGFLEDGRAEYRRGLNRGHRPVFGYGYHRPALR